MPHIRVAANARKPVAVRAATSNPGRKKGAGVYFVCDLGVTMSARVLSHCPAARFHRNRFMEVAGGERVRMPKTVVRLRPVFAHEVMRRMAIVAGGHRPMTGLHPGIKMILHDMAVRARLRVVGKVRSAASVDEGVATDSCRQSEQPADRDSRGADTITRLHYR